MHGLFPFFNKCARFLKRQFYKKQKSYKIVHIFLKRNTKITPAKNIIILSYFLCTTADVKPRHEL